jgi:hypothetical protein
VPQGNASRDVKAVLDLIKQDFQNIPNVTERLFEIGAFHRFDGCLSSVVCPNSEFLKQDLKGKHSWLNASSAKLEIRLNVFGMFFLRVQQIL